MALFYLFFYCIFIIPFSYKFVECDAFSVTALVKVRTPAWCYVICLTIDRFPYDCFFPLRIDELIIESQYIYSWNLPDFGLNEVTTLVRIFILNSNWWTVSSSWCTLHSYIALVRIEMARPSREIYVRPRTTELASDPPVDHTRDHRRAFPFPNAVVSDERENRSA